MQFTAEEDMKIWRFAMEKNQEEGLAMWEVFKNKTDSTRHAHNLFRRFRYSLRPNLPFTKFHTETKLKLCILNKFRVDEEFLKALERDATVKLNSEGIVTAYIMKPTVGPNTDMELDDEEFLKLTTPIMPNKINYTEEEDAEMWKYVIENHRKYTKRSETFWKDLARRMENGRSHKALERRFNRIRDSQLHTIDMDMEVKLELYKRCEIPVDPEYLKTLEEHYDLKVDAKRRIVKYEKINHGEIRISNEKKLEQRNSSISVKTEDVGEPAAKRARYEKEFYIDSESDLDETDSESRFGDFGDVENQKPIHRFLEEDHPEHQTTLEALPEDEPQGSTSRGYRETRSMAKNKNIEQKVAISKNTEKKTMKRTRNSEEFQFSRLDTGGSSAPVIPENQLDANGSGVQLQELENRIVEKLTTVVQNAIVTVSEDLIDAKITKMSKNLKESLQTEIFKVSRSIGTLTEEVRDVSRKILPDGEKESRKKKEFLLNLKNLISPFHAPELEDVVQRIDEAVQNSPEDDVDPNQMRMIRSSLDMMLLAIGH